MAGTRARTGLLSLLLAAVVACSGSDDGGGGSCPEGTAERSSANESMDAAETRDDAIRAQLEDLELAATDDAISDAVVASSPGPAAGTEQVRIATAPESGPITMVLEPLNPGWGVRSTSYCVPDDSVSG